MESKVKILRAFTKIKEAIQLIKEAAIELSDDQELSVEIKEIEELLESSETMVKADQND